MDIGARLVPIAILESAALHSRLNPTRLLLRSVAVVRRHEFEHGLPQQLGWPITKNVFPRCIGVTKLTSMPTAQFSHVIDTLRNLPEELQPQGQQALAEIKGQLARQIYAAGDRGGTQNGASMWNAANVTRELNNQASKMALVFSPEEISKFETLNRGGHILQTPSAYPGAAVQGHNILQRGMIWAPAAIGSGLGGAIGHAIGGYPGMVAGTAAGSTFGSSAATKMATRIDTANANKLRALMGNPKPVTK